MRNNQFLSEEIKMTNRLRCHILYVTFFSCVLFLLLCSTIAVATENEDLTEQKRISFQEIVVNLTKTVESRKFSLFKNQVRYQEPLRLEFCNTDVGTDISVDGLVKILERDSRNTEIRVNQKSGNGMIETEGWNSEHPFFYFEYSYLKTEKQWYWTGVCVSPNRSLDFAMFLGGKDKLYDTIPKLPRSGPRIFKDEIALRSRIEEIVRFKAFDALKPYAVSKVLTFGPCNREMMVSDQIEGKNISVEEVVSFLKKKAPANREIISSEMQHKTYYETVGWNGEYPYIAFWFSKKDKGWALAGVSYCKTRHFDLFKSSQSPK